jgi:signal transduction histidine kinase
LVSDLSKLWFRAGPELTAASRWIFILGGITVIGGLHWFLPLTLLHWHNILQHLYYLPIVYAGMCFGWRGGLAAGLLAGLSSLPYSFRLLDVMAAYAGDQLLDIGLFCGAGSFTGILASRERAQRQKLEGTTARLTEVYRELQESFEQVKRAERLSAVGQLSAGLAHEIRNPLASLAGAAGILKRGAADERRAECVEIIEKECLRLNHLLSQFLDFARPRPPRHHTVDLAGLLESVVELAAHAQPARAVPIRLEVAPDVPALDCDPAQIHQAILNLLLNAVQASPDAGEVVVAVQPHDGGISIEVRDQGTGLDESIMDSIFDPFFTTKENGTGLGLSIVHQIAGQHGGTVTAEPNFPRGTVFRMTLPLRQEVRA